jgi:hypothetical protein
MKNLLHYQEGNNMAEEKKDKIILVFPESAKKINERSDIKLGGEQIIDKFSASVDDIKKWFTGFSVKEIELNISGGVSTGEITKLFISAKGETGMKIVLVPK